MNEFDVDIVSEAKNQFGCDVPANITLTMHLPGEMFAKDVSDYMYPFKTLNDLYLAFISACLFTVDEMISLDGIVTLHNALRACVTKMADKENEEVSKKEGGNDESHRIEVE